MGLMRGIGAVRRGCCWRGDYEGVWWRISGFVDSGCGSLLRLEKGCSVGRVGSVIVYVITIIRVLSLDRLYLERGYCAACRDPSHQDFQGSSYLEKIYLGGVRITLSLKSVLPLSTTPSPFFQTILLLAHNSASNPIHPTRYHNISYSTLISRTYLHTAF